MTHGKSRSPTCSLAKMPPLKVSNQNRTLILEQVGAPGNWLHAIANSISMMTHSETLPARHLLAHTQTCRLVHSSARLLDWRCELVSESKCKSGLELFAYHIRRWRRCRDDTDQRSRNKCARSSRRKRLPHSFTARILMSQLSLIHIYVEE